MEKLLENDRVDTTVMPSQIFSDYKEVVSGMEISSDVAKLMEDQAQALKVCCSSYIFFEIADFLLSIIDYFCMPVHRLRRSLSHPN